MTFLWDPKIQTVAIMESWQLRQTRGQVTEWNQLSKVPHIRLMCPLGGGLQVKILKRTAQFDTSATKSEMKSESDSSSHKLNIPKKTKLFVDQTMRERDNALDMHRIFQGDLFRLKLHIYREVFRVVSQAKQPVSECLPVRVSAQVLGLGPVFSLQVALHNTSAQSALAGLFLLLDFDSCCFKLSHHHVDLPMILPKQSFDFAVRVEALTAQIVDNVIKVYVIREDVPLVTAVVTMPLVEGEKPPETEDHNFEELPLSGELKKHAERMTADLLDIYQHSL
ncbi:BBS1 [Cordylochernes scorpioides]|uniref:BBS1 n=1 Tax=Cordylochernes scorpioides TaxID=51811 RepID=A0ABY6L0W6_9ARAC|nr:BBS1 [Cordylochernes scorpioides]